VTYHDGSGIAHYEVWRSSVFVLLYVWTNQGYRELKFAPSYQLSSMLKNTEKQMDSLRQGAAVSRYDHLLPVSETSWAISLLPDNECRRRAHRINRCRYYTLKINQAHLFKVFVWKTIIF
jgi:hypothetical protein